MNKIKNEKGSKTKVTNLNSPRIYIYLALTTGPAVVSPDD
jgi:hypothetical protein